MNAFPKLLIVLLLLFNTSSLFAKSGKVIRKNYVGFGPGFYTNLNANGVGGVFNIGRSWSLSPKFDLQAQGTLGLSFKHTDAYFISPQLRGKYFLDPKEETSYFVVLGMGYGMASPHGGGSSNSGFAISGAFGLKAFRGKKMEVDVAIEHQMITSEGSTGTPLATFLVVNIYFDKFYKFF